MATKPEELEEFKKSHIETNVSKAVQEIMKDSHKLDVYAEDAILSLTYSDTPVPTPFLEAIRYGDKDAVGRMLIDRIATLVENDVVSKLADEADSAIHMVKRYEDDECWSEI